MTRKKVTIPVGPLVDYTVQFRPNVKHPDGETVLGYCHQKKRYIGVDSELGAQGVMLAFWHEFVHAMFAELGYKQDYDNESKVESIAHALARAFPVIAKNIYEYKTK